MITSYLDGSGVYGSDSERAAALLDQAITISRRLGADGWVRRSEEAALVLGSATGTSTPTSTGVEASATTDMAPGDHHHHRGVFLAWHTAEFWEEADFSKLALVISGGAPCPLPIMEKFWDRGIDFKMGYGLTEAAGNNFWLPPEQKDHTTSPDSIYCRS